MLTGIRTYFYSLYSGLNALQGSAFNRKGYYIAKEFRELYDPGSSDQKNAQRIASSLERSVHTLERVTEQLRFSQDSSPQDARPATSGRADEALLAHLLERLRPTSR